MIYLNSININKYKKRNNKKENNDFVLNYIKNFTSRTLIVLIIFMFLAILIKSNTKYKDIIYNNIYENNLSFTSIKNFYQKHLGGISFIDKILDNKLEYKSSSKFYDGVSLEVGNNYLVPVLETGIVVYIGKKENYGNTIIIQGMDGIEISYSDIETTSIKLYDYIEQGELLGEIKGNSLHLVYSKDGKILNYEEYLK